MVAAWVQCVEGPNSNGSCVAAEQLIERRDRARRRTDTIKSQRNYAAQWYVCRLAAMNSTRSALGLLANLPIENIVDDCLAVVVSLGEKMMPRYSLFLLTCRQRARAEQPGVCVCVCAAGQPAAWLLGWLAT